MQAISIDSLFLNQYWVVISKLSALTGYTDDAIRAKLSRKDWKEGIHWRKGADNRLTFDFVAIQAWMGGHHA